MTTNEIPHTIRMSAGQRKEEILQAAVAEFAERGLHGTSTESIAHRVGVSQPYLFRLFGTKKDLFLAAVARGFDRVEGTFRLAAETDPKDPLVAMGRAYVDLLSNREELLLQMQSYAACSDGDVRDLVRERFGQLFELVLRLSKASDEEVRQFFAQGMLLNVAASMDLPAVAATMEWARRCLGPEHF